MTHFSFVRQETMWSPRLHSFFFWNIRTSVLLMTMAERQNRIGVHAITSVNPKKKRKTDGAFPCAMPFWLINWSWRRPKTHTKKGKQIKKEKKNKKIKAMTKFQWWDAWVINTSVLYTFIEVWNKLDKQNCIAINCAKSAYHIPVCVATVWYIQQKTWET